MAYCKNYCEEAGISTSQLSEEQKTLYYIAENMKIDKSISEEGYRHFQIAIKALGQRSVLDKIKADIEKLPITDTAIKLAGEVIDKYKVESEE